MTSEDGDYPMTQLLERAFTEASKLPEKEQNAVAALLLEELASDKRWDETFASSQNQLAEMARSALREFEADEIPPLEAGACPKTRVV